MTNPAAAATAEALQLYNASNFTQAEKAFEALDHVTPNQPEILIGLGMSQWRCGRADLAKENLLKAIKIQPTHDVALRSMALVLHGEGKFSAAEDYARKAVDLASCNAQNIFTLGVILGAQRKFSQALTYYNKALELNPRYPEALNNIGAIKLEQRDYLNSKKFFFAALELRPQYIEAYKNLAGLFREIGATAESLVILKRILAIDPTISEVWNTLGCLYRDSFHHELSKEAYRKAIALNDYNVDAKANLATELRNAGDAVAARALYEDIIDILPKSIATYIRSALTFPIIMESNEQIEEIRSTLERDLDEIAELPGIVQNPLREMAFTNFYTVYHGKNDRTIQTKLASLLISKAPSLCFESPHLKQWKRGAKIKVGIYSKHFGYHTIGFLWSELFARLDREKFELHIFHPCHQDSKIMPAARERADGIHVTPLDLDQAREIITTVGIDILYFTDIGMEPFSYFLAFSRLAPVQCVTWGHPTTTGIPTVDYFISSRDLEIETAQTHYSEQLVCLPTLNTFYIRPEVKEPVTRAELGLPADGLLYICPQSIFKFHPEMDFIFERIIQSDPTGTLVLLEGTSPGQSERLIKRFEKNIPSILSRTKILPRLTHEKFLGLLQLGDIMLDPIHFGGGSTTLQALALGIPVVTLPSKFLRGRISAACYHAMNFTELIAHDQEHYIQIVSRLARDEEYRHAIQKKIKDTSAPLYKNDLTITELETFFIQALDVYEANHSSHE